MPAFLNHITPSPFSLLLLLALLINISLILIVIRREYQLSVTGSFLIFLSFVVVWTASNYSISISTSLNEYDLWNRIADISFVFVPISFLYFALSYSSDDTSPTDYPLVLSFFIPFIIFINIIPTTDLITVHNEIPKYIQGIGFDFSQGPLFPIYMAWIELCFITSLLTIYSMYKRTNDLLKKKQALLIIWGILIPVIGGTVTDGILPILKIPTPPLAAPLTAFMGVLITYAIIKYGLFIINPNMIATNIIETMPESLIVIDTSNTIRLTNQSVTKLTGYEDKELVDAKIDIFFKDPLALRVLRTEILTKIDNRLPLEEVECEITTKEGIKVPINLFTSVFYDNEGKTTAYILLFQSTQHIKEQNIELQKKMEEIKEQNIKLEELNKLMVGRELKMIKLKEKLEALNVSTETIA
jgi:PAS domain S-box-containing protein